MKKPITYTWKEIAKAIDNAYRIASTDGWGVPSFYKSGLKYELKRKLKKLK